MKTKTNLATVIEVKGADIRIDDPFTGGRCDYGNYVRVRQDDGVEHTFINASINQVQPAHRVVGLRGHIIWHSTSGYNLPFFDVPPKTIRNIAREIVRNAVPRAGVRDTNSECPRYNEVLPDGRRVKAHTKRELYASAVAMMESR